MVKYRLFVECALKYSGTHVESLSFSFFRIPNAFLVRFFSPETAKTEVSTASINKEVQVFYVVSTGRSCAAFRPKKAFMVITNGPSASQLSRNLSAMQNSLV